MVTIADRNIKLASLDILFLTNWYLYEAHPWEGMYITTGRLYCRYILALILCGTNDSCSVIYEYRLTWRHTYVCHCVRGPHCDTFQRRSAGVQWEQSWRWLQYQLPPRSSLPSVHSHCHRSHLSHLTDPTDWLTCRQNLYLRWSWWSVCTCVVCGQYS